MPAYRHSSLSSIHTTFPFSNSHVLAILVLGGVSAALGAHLEECEGACTSFGPADPAHEVGLGWGMATMGPSEALGPRSCL